MICNKHTHRTMSETPRSSSPNTLPNETTSDPVNFFHFSSKESRQKKQSKDE
uniref:Uncharacterized protein n=1 Tax=Arundo donax TaxID=35708 RepID=A0A0A9F4G3_ARUDO